MIEDDYYNDYKGIYDSDDFELDTTETRESYAQFICALQWNQINMSDLKNRNIVFNALKYIGEKHIFQQGMHHHSKRAYETNRHYFSLKQSKFLEKMFLSLENEYDTQSDADDVDTSDDEAYYAPGVCPSCQDVAPGSRMFDYLCDNCLK